MDPPVSSRNPEARIVGFRSRTPAISVRRSTIGRTELMDVLKALGGQKWQHNKVKRAFRLSCPFTEAATPPLSLFSRNGFPLGWDGLYEGRTRRPPVANSAVAPFRADPRFAKLMRAGRFSASMLSKEQRTSGPPSPPTPFRLLWPTLRPLLARSL